MKLRLLLGYYAQGTNRHHLPLCLQLELHRCELRTLRCHLLPLRYEFPILALHPLIEALQHCGDIVHHRSNANM